MRLLIEKLKAIAIFLPEISEIPFGYEKLISHFDQKYVGHYSLGFSFFSFF